MRTEHAKLDTDRAATAQALATTPEDGLGAPSKFPSTWSKQSRTRPQPDRSGEQRRPRELVASKSVSDLNTDRQKPFVGRNDAVRKKLLFRAGDCLTTGEQPDGEEGPAVTPQEQVQMGLAESHNGKTEAGTKPGQVPVIQKSRLTKATVKHSQSVAKMKQLKPIALNQISISKPRREDEINCDSGIS